MPVISAATQAGLEGYLRLERKLAAQRTYIMADATAFLMPAVIGDTRRAVLIVDGAGEISAELIRFLSILRMIRQPPRTMNALLLPTAHLAPKPLRLRIVAVLLMVASLGSGCVSSQFHAVKASTPPPLELNLPSTPKQALQAYVDTVIVYRGAGSWKRYAYWDEYVISLNNSCTAPSSLVSAMLVDAEGREVAPGRDWQQLESESVKWWETVRLGQKVVLGASGLLVVGSAVAAPVSVLVGAAALSGVAVGTGGAALIAAPFVAGAFAWRNVESEKTIRAEFERRRLEIPQTMGGSSTLHGSLFFPITPAPRKLVLTYRHHGKLHTSTIDLTRISDLHLTPSGVTETPVVGVLPGEGS